MSNLNNCQKVETKKSLTIKGQAWKEGEKVTLNTLFSPNQVSRDHRLNSAKVAGYADFFGWYAGETNRHNILFSQ